MLYKLGTVAFVGGSFSGTGGHNMLEPAIFKKPVVVGPSTFNFAEDMERLRQGDGVCEAKDGADLRAILTSLLKDDKERARIGASGYDVVQQFKGAVEKNLELIEKYMVKDE